MSTVCANAFSRAPALAQLGHAHPHKYARVRDAPKRWRPAQATPVRHRLATWNGGVRRATGRLRAPRAAPGQPCAIAAEADGRRRRSRCRRVASPCSNSTEMLYIHTVFRRAALSVDGRRIWASDSLPLVRQALSRGRLRSHGPGAGLRLIERSAGCGGEVVTALRAGAKKPARLRSERASLIRRSAVTCLSASVRWASRGCHAAQSPWYWAVAMPRELGCIAQCLHRGQSFHS